MEKKEEAVNKIATIIQFLRDQSIEDFPPDVFEALLDAMLSHLERVHAPL